LLEGPGMTSVLRFGSTSARSGLGASSSIKSGILFSPHGGQCVHRKSSEISGSDSRSCYQTARDDVQFGETEPGC
jgi:hypothetical protein